MTINGETIFEYDLDVTGATDYGVTMDAIFGGQEKIPLQGARFDIAFAGPVRGRLSGLLRGVDYLNVRADGRRDLISGRPSRPLMGAGLLSPPTVSPLRVKTSQSSTYL